MRLPFVFSSAGVLRHVGAASRPTPASPPRWPLTGVTAAVVVLAAACGRPDGEAEASPATAGADSPAATAAPATAGSSTGRVVFTPAQAQHGGVRWAAAAAADLAKTLELPGQLVPNEDRTARVGAPAQGRIMAVHVQLGDRVAQGQPLVTLQSPEASAARADLEKAVAGLASARAGATYARTARERAERLLAIKAASRQEAERTQADDEAARAVLQQAQAEVARARAAAAQLGGASVSGAMVLRSPVTGIVLSREAAPGTVADAGAPLVTVADTRVLWLEVAASDRVAGGIRPGARVRFRVPAFPADTFEARVQSVGGALDTATRTVPVRATVDNGAGRLRPAMFATTWIESGERRQAVLLPTEAVQLLDNRSVVFVARPDGKGGATFERRDIEAGPPAGGQTPVLGGIAPGDVVVVAGAFAVKSEFARAKMAQE